MDQAREFQLAERAAKGIVECREASKLFTTWFVNQLPDAPDPTDVGLFHRTGDAPLGFFVFKSAYGHVHAVFDPVRNSEGFLYGIVTFGLVQVNLFSERKWKPVRSFRFDGKLDLYLVDTNELIGTFAKDKKQAFAATHERMLSEILIGLFRSLTEIPTPAK